MSRPTTGRACPCVLHSPEKCNHAHDAQGAPCGPDPWSGARWTGQNLVPAPNLRARPPTPSGRRPNHNKVMCPIRRATAIHNRGRERPLDWVTDSPPWAKAGVDGRPAAYGGSANWSTDDSTVQLDPGYSLPGGNARVSGYEDGVPRRPRSKPCDRMTRDRRARVALRMFIRPFMVSRVAASVHPAG